MRSAYRMAFFYAITFAFGIHGWSQSSQSAVSTDTQKAAQQDDKRNGPGREMGRGGEDVGTSVAKGTGDMAKGTAGAVGNLAQGNMGGAGASLGKGAGGMGKHMVAGTAKGMGKIGKGVGGEFKKLGAKSTRHGEEKPANP